MSNGIVGLIITIILSVITIWYKVFFKVGVSFYGLKIRNKLLSESSNRIETHFYVIVEYIEVHISVAFEFYLDEEFMEFL